VQETKAGLRAGILATRRALAAEVRTAEAEALCAHAAALVRPGDTVCAYVPVGSEPGSIAMLAGLVSAGATVLLPVAREDATGTPLPLRWGDYRDRGLVAARHGLLEPPPPWHPAEAIGTASLVVVPALAVDRSGTRLGRGAGFYDRSLPLADRSARLVAMIRDDEVLDALPREPHDVPMTHALTPGRGLIALAGPPGMARPT
jgi:5-formyltetrahydrofolate cyclo-ligase